MSLVFTGYYRWDNGTTQGQGTQGVGYWWSSTALQNLINQAGNAGVGIDTIGSYFGLYKIYSFSLRCIGITPYGSTSARSYPVSLVYAGYYSWNTSNLANQTAAGYYESLLANPNNTDYYFLLRLGANVNYILPQFTDHKAVGFSLRYPTAPLPRVVTRYPWCFLEYIIGVKEEQNTINLGDIG